MECGKKRKIKGLILDVFLKKPCSRESRSPDSGTSFKIINFKSPPVELLIH